jgi:hypothetical protein
MHPLPRRHRLAVADADPYGIRKRPARRNRPAVGPDKTNRGPHHLRPGRCRRMARAGPDPAFPAGVGEKDGGGEGEEGGVGVIFDEKSNRKVVK